MEDATGASSAQRSTERGEAESSKVPTPTRVPTSLIPPTIFKPLVILYPRANYGHGDIPQPRLGCSTWRTSWCSQGKITEEYPQASGVAASDIETIHTFVEETFTSMKKEGIHSFFRHAWDADFVRKSAATGLNYFEMVTASCCRSLWTIRRAARSTGVDIDYTIVQHPQMRGLLGGIEKDTTRKKGELCLNSYPDRFSNVFNDEAVARLQSKYCTVLTRSLDGGLESNEPTGFSGVQAHLEVGPHGADSTVSDGDDELATRQALAMQSNPIGIPTLFTPRLPTQIVPPDYPDKDPSTGWQLSSTGSARGYKRVDKDSQGDLSG